MEHLLVELLATRENMISRREEIMAHVRAWRKEMKTDRETTEAYPEKMEENPEEIICSGV
jgi:hypothetical protein